MFSENSLSSHSLGHIFVRFCLKAGTLSHKNEASGATRLLWLRKKFVSLINWKCSKMSKLEKKPATFDLPLL